MYSAGDVIIYGSEGVCKIDKIDKMNINGIKNDKMYYYLTPLYHGGIIYAPMDTPVIMRNVISKDEALRLIDKIPEIPADICKNNNIRLLNEHYQSIIKSCDCEDLVKVIKSIEAKRAIALEKGKKLGAVEERYLNKAKDMLLGELAVSLGTDKDNVDRFIRETVNN